MQECGPRFTLKLVTLQHGTFDPRGGEFEWVHKVKFTPQVMNFSFNVWSLEFCFVDINSSFHVLLFRYSLKWILAGGGSSCDFSSFTKFLFICFQIFLFS